MGNIPVLQCLVLTAAHQSTPIRGEFHAENQTSVFSQHLRQFTGASVPDIYRLSELHSEYTPINDDKSRTPSTLPAATSRPSELIATLLTLAPAAIARIFDDPSIISQILVVLSADPETTNLPSGEKTTELTSEV